MPDPARPPAISAVVPAFNEVAVIAGVATRVDAALRAAGVAAHEVVVVDDGSSDGTGAAVEALGIAAVRVVRHSRNRGYGAALRTGFESAVHDTVWLLDGDGQFDPADLPRLLAAWRPSSYVIGVRAKRQDSRMRRLNHAAFFALVRAVVGPTTTDVNCAFRLFPRRLGVGLHFDGALVSTEMAVRARHEGMPIVEVVIPHHARLAGVATGAKPQVILRAFGELWRIRRMTTGGGDPWAGAVPADPAVDRTGQRSSGG